MRKGGKQINKPVAARVCLLTRDFLTDEDYMWPHRLYRRLSYLISFLLITGCVPVPSAPSGPDQPPRPCKQPQRLRLRHCRGPTP